MFKVLTLAIVSLMSCFGSISAEEQSNPNKEKIVERLKKFTDDYNNGKDANIGEYWTENAEIFNPVTGEAIVGKENVVQYLQSRMKELNGDKLVFNVTHIEYPDENSAAIEGTLEFLKNGKVIDRRARKIGLIKDNGTWYLDVIREIQVPPAPSSYERLKDLEWLLGNWKDKDEDVTIEFKTKWDAHQNFLIQKFNMNVYGIEELQGMEIIGWDPVEKNIRSWIFDSDGGFGSGIWTKEGANWKVKVNYVLPNGVVASDIDMFSNINEKSYTYSTSNRKEGNESLPDIEPVTVLRGE